MVLCVRMPTLDMYASVLWAGVAKTVNCLALRICVRIMVHVIQTKKGIIGVNADLAGVETNVKKKLMSVPQIPVPMMQFNVKICSMISDANVLKDGPEKRVDNHVPTFTTVAISGKKNNVVNSCGL